MSSVVEICNMALSHIGCKFITSLSELTPEAKQCNLLYEPSRDQVLVDHPWNFSEKEGYISLLTGEDSERYDYAYVYPNDCLDIRRVHQTVSGAQPVEYLVVSKDDGTTSKILTNQETALLVYTRKITNPEAFSTGFVMALSWKLASELAMPLTKSLNKVQAALSVYSGYVSAAKNIDSNEGIEDIQITNDFISSRG